MVQLKCGFGVNIQEFRRINFEIFQTLCLFITFSRSPIFYVIVPQSHIRRKYIFQKDAKFHKNLFIVDEKYKMWFVYTIKFHNITTCICIYCRHEFSYIFSSENPSVMLRFVNSNKKHILQRRLQRYTHTPFVMRIRKNLTMAYFSLLSCTVIRHGCDNILKQQNVLYCRYTMCGHSDKIFGDRTFCR